MTDLFDEHGDLLRRALHAEADQVIPAPDGLDRIRARTAEGRVMGGWVWLTTSWTRPLAAVGAATALALLAVSAPPAINSITATLSGDQKPAPHKKRPSPSESSPGSGRSNRPSTGVQPAPQNSQAPLPPPPWGVGSASCLSPSPTPSAKKTVTHRPEKSTPAGTPRGTPLPICPTGSATPTTPTTHSATPAPLGSASPTAAPQASAAPAAAQTAIT